MKKRLRVNITGNLLLLFIWAMVTIVIGAILNISIVYSVLMAGLFVMFLRLLDWIYEKRI